VEAGERGIPWTKPQDPALTDVDPRLTSVLGEENGGHREDHFFWTQFFGRNVVTVDGRAFCVAGGVDPEVWQQMLSVDVGDSMPLPEVVSAANVPRKVNVGNCLRFGLWRAIVFFPFVSIFVQGGPIETDGQEAATAWGEGEGKRRGGRWSMAEMDAG